MKNSSPLVSIAIPTYNRANSSLPETLQSAVDQDYENIEIIVSDNCSNDNTEEVVGSFKSEKITYIKQTTNIGPTGNYNACLNAARGDYFLLLHDDDLIDPDFVSTYMKHAGYKDSYGVIRGGTRMIDAYGNMVNEPKNIVNSNNAVDLYEAWLTGQIAFYLCSTIFNRRALEEIGGFHSLNNLFEDGIAIIKISNKYPVLNLKEVKSSFRQHEEQRTHAAAAIKWCGDFRQAIDLICLYEADRRNDLYEKGMINFSKVGIHFARKIKNPIKRSLAFISITRYFPFKYWPRRSWKTTVLGTLGSIIHRNKKQQNLS